MADAGTDTFDRDFALSLVSSEQEALSEIEAAIKRIHDGTYGICESPASPSPRSDCSRCPSPATPPRRRRRSNGRSAARSASAAASSPTAPSEEGGKIEEEPEE